MYTESIRIESQDGSQKMKRESMEDQVKCWNDTLSEEMQNVEMTWNDFGLEMNLYREFLWVPWEWESLS